MKFDAFCSDLAPTYCQAFLKSLSLSCAGMSRNANSAVGQFSNRSQMKSLSYKEKLEH